MNNNTKISVNQLTLLLITIVGVTALLYAPAMAIREAGQNAWLSLLVPPTLYGIGVVWVTTRLSLRFSHLPFHQYMELITGKNGSRLIFLIYFLYTASLLIVIVREFGTFLSASFMPETPLIVFNLSLILLASYATIKGLEVIARINQFVFPLLLITMFLLFLFLIKDMEPAKLLPILDQGLIPVFKGSTVPSAFRGEVFVLLWLVHHLKTPGESTKGGIIAVIVLGVLLMIDVMSILMVMGKELATRQVFPTLLLARYANISTFTNRVEGVVMVIWVSGVVIKCSALFFVAVETIKATFGYPENKDWYFIIPSAAIILFGALFAFKNDLFLIWYMKNILPPSSLVFQFLLPSLILLIAWIRKKGVGLHG